MRGRGQRTERFHATQISQRSGGGNRHPARIVLHRNIVEFHRIYRSAEVTKGCRRCTTHNRVFGAEPGADQVQVLRATHLGEKTK